MNQDKTMTIKEIAKALNVSVSTVSRALNDHSSISANTRKRIQQFAEDNNYQKNFAAVNFKTGKSFSLGVILPEIRDVQVQVLQERLSPALKRHPRNSKQYL